MGLTPPHDSENTDQDRQVQRHSSILIDMANSQHRAQHRVKSQGSATVERTAQRSVIGSTNPRIDPQPLMEIWEVEEV
jgi:hypothetical protein